MKSLSIQSLRILPVLLILALILPPTTARGQGGFNLPHGFIQEMVTAGLTLPTSFALAPDGRIFFTEKAGRVRVFHDGELLSTPFLDITSEVNDAADRGLMGIAVDPDWPSSPYIYLAYAYDPPEVKDRNPTGARVSRVMRISANPDNLDVATPGSGLILVGANSTAENIGNPDQGDAEPFSCLDGEGQPVRDCIPTEGTAHTVDFLKFGPEGALYVSLGDGIVNSKGNSRALDINSLAGKILRINPTTGAGYADNPFYDGDLGSNRAKVYALGMRNPFRFTIDPRDGQLIVGEVGNEKWEEINVGGAGSNFGWPCYEGPYEAATYADCDAFDSGAWTMTPGVYSYEHTTKPQRGAAIGGDLYLGRSFPALYRGAYFYHDFNGGVVDFLTFNADGSADNNEFATNVPGIVQITATDDALYVLSVILGGLWRIRYVPGGNQPPTAGASADPLGGQAPLEVSFSSKRSTDPENSIVAYAWDFGDGETSSRANPIHTFAENGVYAVALTVTDSAGATSSDSLDITVGSEPPTAEIVSPGDGAKFRIGETITFEGKGSDPDEGDLPGDRLQWNGILHHHEHLHYDAVNTTGASGSFVLEDHGDDTYVELCLTATDEQGLEDQECVDLKPQEVTYTFNTVPGGLAITYGGSRYETPFKVKSYINAQRIVEAPLNAGDGLTFDSWSDGGEAVHMITVEDGDRTLTATYTDNRGEPIAADDTADLENAPLVTPEPAMNAMGEMPAETDVGTGLAEADAEPAKTESVEVDVAVGSTAAGSPEVAPLVAGSVIAEVWTGVDGTTIEELTQSTIYRNDAPDTIALDSLALPRGGGNNYGARIRGFLVPPETGDYRFWIAADDRGVFFLSTDDSPDNQIVVAYTPEWTAPGDYERYPEQITGPIELEAGERYYFEVLYKQGDGKDNLSVAWETPGTARAVIDGAFIAPYMH